MVVEMNPCNVINAEREQNWLYAWWKATELDSKAIIQFARKIEERTICKTIVFRQISLKFSHHFLLLKSCNDFSLLLPSLSTFPLKTRTDIFQMPSNQDLSTT